MSSWHNDSDNKKTDTKSPPKLEDGSYDRELVKQLYMESKFMDWTRFAESQMWDALFTRRQFPVATWQVEKRKGILEMRADRLMGELFDRRFKWHYDVNKTLNEYPELCDSIFELIKTKTRDYQLMAREYINAMNAREWKSRPVDEKGRPVKFEFDGVKVDTIATLAEAMKKITDAKHRNLLINNWKIDLANAEATPEEVEAAAKGLMFKVMGYEEALSTADIQNMMDQYLDKPALPAPEEPEKPTDGT